MKQGTVKRLAALEAAYGDPGTGRAAEIWARAAAAVNKAYGDGLEPVDTDGAAAEATFEQALSTVYGTQERGL